MVSHCSPGQGQHWTAMPKPPHTGGILAHRRGHLPPPGRRVRCVTLVCSGGCPYCWYVIFKVRQLGCYTLIVEDTDFIF